MKGLRCVDCGQEFEARILYSCPRCDGILEVSYVSSAFMTPKDGELGIWRYKENLPSVDKENIVSLGEGNTALLPSIKRGSSLFFKLESGNPTGSFKDRGISVAVSVAKQMNALGIVIASSGNAAAATAAYAARALLPCRVYVPCATSASKVEQAGSHGVEICLVEGSFSESYREADIYARQKNFVNTTTTFINPYNLEGNKTVAYEIYESLKEMPFAVIVPTGAGPLLVGLHKGFKELKESGMNSPLPRLIGVQAKTCAPIADAWEKAEGEVKDWPFPFSSIAQGIADPLIGYAADGTHTLRAIRESGGLALTLSEEEIAEAARTLAREEGLYAEPSGAVGWTAYQKLAVRGYWPGDAKVVSIVTGHGLKQSGASLRG